MRLIIQLKKASDSYAVFFLRSLRLSSQNVAKEPLHVFRVRPNKTFSTKLS